MKLEPISAMVLSTPDISSCQLASSCCTHELANQSPDATVQDMHSLCRQAKCSCEEDTTHIRSLHVPPMRMLPEGARVPLENLMDASYVTGSERGVGCPTPWVTPPPGGLGCASRATGAPLLMQAQDLCTRQRPPLEPAQLQSTEWVPGLALAV